MRSPVILTAAAAACLLVGACNKPAGQAATDTANATANGAANAADSAGAATADATQGATAPGGAVSPPAANGAVNADANTANANTTAAANSFTEAEAKGHIEHAGYTDVSALTKTPDGLWTGQAKKGGKPVSVSVDFKGAVSAK